MDRVVVYGLGKGYENNKSIIEREYTVVGYCDSISEKMYPFSKLIRIEELKKREAEYDYILITSVKYAMDIVQKLQKYNIDKGKIKIFQHEDNAKLFWKIKPYRGISYSGSLEDIVIDNIMNNLQIPYESMRYVELGVMDPIGASNTYYFYQRGASGILVEANPELIENIKWARKRDKIINKAVYVGKGDEVTLYVSEDAGLSSLISNHIEGNSDWEKHGIIDHVKVPVIHINDIFSMLGSDKTKCDLLSIDIEGYDLEALKSLDFGKYRPKVIIEELNWTHITGRDYYQKLVDLLIQNDYILYANNQYNGIFVDKRYASLL